MSKHPDYDDNELIHENTPLDPLGEIYSGLVTPDIEEINEHAETLAAQGETEPDHL